MRIDNERELRRLILQTLSERVGIVALAPNAAGTTVTDARIRFDSPILLQATTANAAAEIANGTLYVSEVGRINGAVTLIHADNAQTDRIFRFFIG